MVQPTAVGNSLLLSASRFVVSSAFILELVTVGPKQPRWRANDLRVKYLCYSCHDLWLLHVRAEVKLQGFELGQVTAFQLSSEIVRGVLVGVHLNVCVPRSIVFAFSCCLHGGLEAGFLIAIACRGESLTPLSCEKSRIVEHCLFL
jgi:hypothetical protein